MTFSIIIFQIIIVMIVPTLSLVQGKMINELTDIAISNRKKLYLQSAFNQIALAGFAIWAAFSSNLDLSYIGYYSRIALIVGIGVLSINFIISFTSSYFSKEETNPGLDVLIPKTNAEKIVWVGVNLCASICEEIIFRVVLYHLFLQTTQNEYAAALISALVFGVSHGLQGYIGIIMSFGFGLCLQWIVNLSDGIAIAAITHFLHNMIATVLSLKLRSKE